MVGICSVEAQDLTNNNQTLTIKETHTFSKEDNLGEFTVDIIGGKGDITITVVNHYGEDLVFNTRKKRVKNLQPGLYVVIAKDNANNLSVMNIKIGIE